MDNTLDQCKKSTSILTDIKYFFFEKPGIETFIKINTPSDREYYNDLVHNRIGEEISNYKLLNIHRIGIQAPAEFIFNELMNWGSDSCWWPNHIAKVNVLDAERSKINIFLFGNLSLKPKKMNRPPGFHLLRLFNLTLIKKEQNRDKQSDENVHFLLYKCSGGYPIGIFNLFTRNSDPERNESGLSQLFMMVGFNPHGIKFLSRIKLITKPWEKIHNRVSSNALFRIKKYCEANYQLQNNNLNL